MFLDNYVLLFLVLAIVLMKIGITEAETAKFVEFEGQHLLYGEEIVGKNSAWFRCRALCGSRVKVITQDEYDLVVRFMKQYNIKEAMVLHGGKAGPEMDANYAPGHPGQWESDGDTWIDGNDGYSWKSGEVGRPGRPYMCWKPDTPVGCAPDKTNGCLFREFLASQGGDGGGEILETLLDAPSLAHCARKCCVGLPTCAAYNARKNGKGFTCEFYGAADYSVKGHGDASAEESYYRLEHR